MLLMLYYLYLDDAKIAFFFEIWYRLFVLRLYTLSS